MDNNDTPQEQTFPSQPIPSVQSSSEPSVEVKEKSHFFLLFIALFLLGILFLGGTYWYIQSQKSLSFSPAPVKNSTIEQQKEFNDMNMEVETMEAKDIDTDFTQIDQEMKNL